MGRPKVLKTENRSVETSQMVEQMWKDLGREDQTELRKEQMKAHHLQ